MNRRGPMVIEGVRYYPFRVRLRLTNGRQCNWIRYAPAWVYAREAVARELDANGLEAKSGTIREAF